MTLATTADAAELTEDNLEYVIAAIDKKVGIQLQGKEYLIASRLQPLVTEFKVPSANDLVARMRRGDRRIETAIMDSMTTNETSFFRDLHPFETLATQILPDRLQSAPRLKIWNGACSSGQESYTLAMLIDENFPNLANKVSIVSTDVSPAMVQRTKEGTYSRFEINRGLPANLALKYFDQAGRNWTAKPTLKSMIETRELNLMESLSSVGRCEVVLLRNVLIYFTAEKKKDILTRIRRDVLNPGGCLLLGAAETTVGFDPAFESRQIGKSTFFYIKGAS